MALSMSNDLNVVYAHELRTAPNVMKSNEDEVFSPNNEESVVSMAGVDIILDGNNDCD